MSMPESDIFAVIGETGLSRVVEGFFRRVPSDPVLSRIYPPADLAGAANRLRGFLIYRFGGPWTYIEERGHPRLRMRHAPFDIDQSAADAWVAAMLQSVDEASLPPEASATLRKFFTDTASFLINRAGGEE